MTLLRANQWIERTDAGTEAWGQTAMMPIDRKVLGLARVPKRVSELLTQTDANDPAGLEATIGRLARKGWVVVRDEEALAPVDVLGEPTAFEPVAEGTPEALDALLARHRQAADPLEASPVEVDPPRAAGAPSGPAPASAPATVRPPAAPRPDVHVPMGPETDRLIEALTQGRGRAPVPAVAPESEAPRWSGGVAALLIALGDTEGAAKAAAEAASKPVASAPPLPPVARPTRSAPPAAPSGFARLKDAPATQEPAARTGPPQTPVQKQQAERAQREREERERRQQQKQAEMAKNQAREQAARGNTLLGLSERLRSTMDKNKS